jgi:hypothetical protein
MNKHKFNIFPEMQQEDYDRLRNDILINGYDLKNPIYLYQNEILDGWNRQKVCDELKVQPVYKDFSGTDQQAIEFVMRSNKRRNLTSSQWAAIAVEADELIEALKEAAKERMLDGKGNPVKLISQGTEENKTCHKLAETFNTNRTYVNEAAKLRDEKPEIFQQVKSGEKTITEAKREIKREEIIRKNDEIIKQEAIQPTGKYDVIVIDPPWQMKKIEREVAPEQVEFDYPTMDYDEILNIEIPASDNCHIFLWTTQKHLPYAFEILEKWGANYVFTMVWHKNGGFQPFGLPQYNLWKNWHA